MKAASLAVAAALLLIASARGETPRLRLERCFTELELDDAGRGELPECFLDAVRGLSPAALGARWETATEGEKRRFERAFAAALRREIPEGASADLRSEDSDSRGSRLVYRVRAGGADLGEATLLLSPEGSPSDVLWQEGSLMRRYRELCERTLERYSFAYLLGELEGKGVVVLEDFEDGPLGELPSGWERRGFGGVGTIPYRVLAEDGNRFLRAEDRGENVMIYKEARWDSRKYPYLSFRFRIRAVPAGSDERIEEKADSAAGLYLSYGRKLGVIPETVKFVWSGAIAAGTAFRRPGIGMPWTVVAGSGAADETSWHRFVFDTGRVYQETFGGSGGDRPLGIGLLTDANATRGFAAADYDDIVLLERSEAEDRIRKIENLSTN
jgi:hypothetical protein